MRKEISLPTQKQLVNENAGLRARLDEAEDTLRAIRSGEVDAIVVSGVGGEHIFTLNGAERTYRVLIEDMNEGALTLTAEGVISYANHCFAGMLRTPLEKVIGSTIYTWIKADNQRIFRALLKKSAEDKCREELVLTTGDGTQMPVYLSVTRMSVDRLPDCFSLVATDLTEQKKRSLALVAAEKSARKLLEERQRLAHDLHDAVNQSLFSASLIAEVLPRIWERDQAEARRSLEDLRRLTNGALAEMRALLAELRPSILIDSNLGDLLRQLATAFSGRTNIPVRLDIARENVLSADLQVTFYRICQEALNNIAKHAGASQVQINLQYDTNSGQAPISFANPADLRVIAVNSVEMCIRDNGHGFNTSQPEASGHYGQSIMREQVEAAGAQLTFTSQPGHGTEVRLRWPATTELEAEAR